MSLMSISSKCSDIQELVPVNSAPCQSNFVRIILLCSIGYINCLQDAKKRNLMLGLKKLDGSCNKDCHEKFLQIECISCW